MYEPVRSLLWRLRRGLRRMSIDITHFNRQSADYQIADLIRRRRIECILDVGANRGQFARYMRLQGFKGTIHSFEPLTDAFSAMRDAASRDRNWHVHNIALSNRSGSAVLNVGANDQTSSLQAVAMSEDASLVKFTGTQTVQCHRLDDLFSSGELGSLTPDRTMVKIDVQGHELDVLSGAGDILHSICSLLIETSIVNIYQSEPSVEEISEYLRNFDFMPVTFKGGFHHPQHGYLMQIDVVFENFGAFSAYPRSDKLLVNNSEKI